MPEVFKLQSPSTGKVVQIEADSPEMAFDILDEIEAGQMGGATAALGLPNAAPAVDMGKRFLGGVGRALNPMNLLQAGADVAGSQLDALSQGDLTGLIPFAPMAKQAATRTVDRLGEATRLAVDEGDYLGAAGQAGAAIPVVGEMAAGMGERAAETGDYAGLAGELTGAAFGPKLGRGAATGAGMTIRPIVKGLKKAAPIAREVARTAGPEVVGTAVGAIAGGPMGGLVGGIVANKVKEAVSKAMRASSKAEPMKRGITKAQFEQELAHSEALKRQAKLDAKPQANKPPTVTVPGETGPRVVSPQPAPTAPNPPARPSSVPQTARDVDSALKSLDKASQARLKHVVKKAESKVETPKGDVVYAPPAFKGQQSGGTRARFEHQAKRQAKLREDAIKADAQNRANELGMRVRELKQSGKTPAEIRETIASETGFDADSVSQLVNIALKGAS